MKTDYINKKIVVTGGAGFIGSHLCESLLRNGAHVTVLDNLSTGSYENMASFIDSITFIKGDITDYATCLQATKAADIVFHLAAFVSVPESLEHPFACHTTNVTGTVALLEALRANNVARCVFSSSSSVYGNHTDACDELSDCRPTSPYGYSKLIGELYCRQYATSFNLKTVCLRYFNVFGERQNPHGPYAGVVAKFRHNMEHNLPLTIFGDGSQSRDFVSVEKVVEANMRLALLPDQQMNGDSYNIASGTGTTIQELVTQLLKKYPNYSGPISYQPQRNGDLYSSKAHCYKYDNLNLS